MARYLVTIFNHKDGSIDAEFYTNSTSPARAIANIMVNNRDNPAVFNMTDDHVVQAQCITDNEEKVFEIRINDNNGNEVYGGRVSALDENEAITKFLEAKHVKVSSGGNVTIQELK